MNFISRYRFISLSVIAIVTYSSVIFSQTFINPDAQDIFPMLQNITSVSDYFQHLFTFRTIDFQPVRDLSLYLDLFAFNLTRINITIIQNILIWVTSCWVMGKVLEKLFKDLTKLEISLIVILFLSYPLFTQSVCWGIARKHLLSFMFVLFATDRMIQKDEYSLRDALQINFFFLCSVLSQPISLLWPLWSASYALTYRQNHYKNNLNVLIPGFLILVLVCALNVFYYSTSIVFLNSYASKTNELLEISDKILALGHYVFQVFYPYLLSFRYTLGHWSTLAGLLITGIFAYFLLRMRVNRKEILVWCAFVLGPLLIVLTKSTMLYDTYLLLPAFGFLVLILKLKEKAPAVKIKKPLCIIGIIFFTVFSHYEASAWNNEVLLTKRSFERRPTCVTAFDYLRMSYENDLPPDSPDARNFLYNHVCEKFQTGGMHLNNLKAYLLYYENDLPDEIRIKKLQSLANKGIFPHIALVALYIKFNKTTEATNALDDMDKNWSHLKYKAEYIPIAAKNVYPFCQSVQHKKCIEMLNPFISKKNGLSYR